VSQLSTASEQELRNAYSELDLEPTASAAQIKRRYRELVRAHHPDRWPAGSADEARAAERMRRVNAAYDLIENAPLQGQGAAGAPRPTPSGWERPMDAPPSRSPRAWSAYDVSLFRWRVGYLLIVLAFALASLAFDDDPSASHPWRRAIVETLRTIVWILHRT
jgi:curved DNA-binding protein CbpA